MTVGRTFLHGARRLLLAFAGSQVLWCMACSVYASTPDAETREGLAADPVQKAIDECRMVLERNFNAVNAEDLKQLMKTFSKEAASGQHAADFKEEATKMFADTDVYMRLVDFKIIDIRPNMRPQMAEAMVIQLTLPADEKDREPVRHRRLGLNYKHHSALLPEFELVTYRQVFRYENGKWKLHALAGAVIPTDATTLPDSLPRPTFSR